MRTLEEERAHGVAVRNEWTHIKRELKLQVALLAGLIGTIWALYAVNHVFTNQWLSQHMTVRPRELQGLWGLLVTPFLHMTPAHAIASSIMILFVGWWAMMRDTRDFILVHLVALLTSGAALWAFEPRMANWHGWGGIAMGMAGYLTTKGLFERRWHTVLSSLVAIALLAIPLFGILMPGGAAGSWAGCFGGFAGGVVTAAFLGWRRRRHEDPEDYLGGHVPSVSELAGLDGQKTRNAGLDFTPTTFNFESDLSTKSSSVSSRSKR